MNSTVPVSDNGRFEGLIVLAAVFTSIAAFAVMVRTIIRFTLIRTPGWDDYTMLLAMLLTFGYLAELVISGENGLGSPAATLTVDQMVTFLKAVLAIEINYYLIVGTIKISIVFTYLRFVFSKQLRTTCWATIIFEVVFTIICVTITSAQCMPLEKMWDLTGTVPGTCLNTTAIFYSTSVINILTDIWILILPIKTLTGINRSVREKVALLLIFGVGALATTMSIVRLYSIHIYTLSTDPFRDAIPVNQWSMIEINVAILCASIPALKPLITPRRLQSAIHERRYGGYQHHHDNKRAAAAVSSSSSALPNRRPSAATTNTFDKMMHDDEYYSPPPTKLAMDEERADGRHYARGGDDGDDDVNNNSSVRMVRLPEIAVASRGERSVWADEEAGEFVIMSPDFDLPKQGTFHAV